MTYKAPDTAEVRARQAETGEDWPSAYTFLADFYNPVDTTPAAGEEITSDPYNEGWICACGNDITGDGFEPCDAATGASVEPTIAGPWDGKSVVCNSCGRIMDASTNRRRATGWTVAVVGKATASA